MQYLPWHYKQHLRNIEDVLNAVNHAWDQFCHTQLEKCFCTLQTVFDKVIKSQGGSCYKIQHMKKDAIWRENGVHVLCEQAEQASQAAVNLVDKVFGVA